MKSGAMHFVGNSWRVAEIHREVVAWRLKVAKIFIANYSKHLLAKNAWKLWSKQC